MGAVGGTAVAVATIWFSWRWAVNRFVYANEAYALRRVELRHEGRLRADQIRQWTGVRPGQNLLALDLHRIRRDLEMNPWIERAEVEVRRPDCLRISVREREPRAQFVRWRLNLANRSAWPETNYLDAAGVVLPPLQPDWLRPGVEADFSHLTRLKGIDHAEVVPGQALAVRGVDAALGLIAAYEDSDLYSRVDLLELELGAGGTLLGRLSQGTKLQFGTRDFEVQMRRWYAIHQYATAQGRSLGWLDLSLTNNLPARWQEPTNTPAAPRPAKPPRTARRHV
jgi:hypothetical protein